MSHSFSFVGEFGVIPKRCRHCMKNNLFNDYSLSQKTNLGTFALTLSAGLLTHRAKIWIKKNQRSQ